MPATTPRGAPYPVAADNNDVPADLQALAEWVDAIPGIATVTTTQRDALLVWTGRLVWNTTTSQYERWNGAAWVALTDTVKLADGTAAAPALAFAADPDTGLYRPGAGAVAFASGGVMAGYFTGTQLAMNAAGTAAAPSFTFSGDHDTGLFRPSADRIGVATAGVSRLLIGDDGVVPFLVPTVDAALRLGGSTNRFTRLFLSDYVQNGDGVAGTPAYSFGADPDTGLYRITTNEVGIATAGALRLRVSTATVALITEGSPNCEAIRISGTNYFRPGSDAGTNLGSPSNRWAQIYSNSATISTSDEEQKDDVADSDLGLAFVRALRPIRFRFRDGSRPHHGFGAQQVREALDAVGVADSAVYVDPSVEAATMVNPYAAAQPTPEFVADYLPPEPDPDADEETRAEYARREAEARKEAARAWAEERSRFDAETEAMRTAPKGLRYSELSAPIVKGLQELADKVDALEAENATLRATVDDLVARVTALEGTA